MTKYLFLDFDGVMNNSLTFIHGHQQGEKRTHDPVDIYAVAALNYIMDEVPDCYIVVSSVWRFKGLDYCIDKLVSHGFKHADKVIDVTPNLPNAYRGGEVAIWLKDKADYEYVILDDDMDFYEYQRERLVHTDMYKGGLTLEKMQKTIELLRC